MNYFKLIAVGLALTSLQATNATTPQAFTPVEPIEFKQDLFQHKQEYTLWDDLNTDSLWDYVDKSVDIQWPRTYGNYNLKPLQDSLMKAAFPEFANSIDITEAVNKYLADTTDFAPFMCESRSVSIKIVDYTTSYITCITDFYFCSGFNSNYISTPMTYILESGRLMDYGWLIKPEYEEWVLKEVHQRMLRHFEAETEAELNARGLGLPDFLPDNICIKNGEIVFHYLSNFNYYPYQTGLPHRFETDITLTPYALKEALTPDAYKFFGIVEYPADAE
ncbi:MAG: hypothetical protein J6C77_01045 [Muribaculaceae bacterium]|nr:hypothetical protein [Muribaculaceae bacterium]